MNRTFKLLLAITVIGGIFAFVMASRELNEQVNRFERHLAKPVVLEGDTLTVIDYSFLHETLTLSDGRVIHINLVEK